MARKDSKDIERKKTPKELAKERRDRRLRRRVMAAMGALALLIIGILVYGWYDVNVLSQRQPVVTVNDETVTRQEFKARVRLLQIQLVSQLQRTQSMAAFLGSNAQAQRAIQQQVQQIRMQLSDPTLVGQRAIDQLIQEALIRQEAEERGIAVSEQEVDEEIQELFGYYAEGTPTPAPTLTSLPTSTIDPTVAAEATPNPTTTSRPTKTPGPSPTPMPTATPYTFESFQENYQSYLEALSQQEIREQDFRTFARAQVYRRKLIEEFRADVPREQEQVHARHILVEEEETAQEVLQRVEQGASFTELAVEYSLDESNKNRGGDLGWVGRGEMVDPFEQAIFDASVGDVVGPVQTQFGFHVIEILGREMRRLEDAAYERAVQRAFNLWLSQARDQADVEIREDWVQIVPTVAGGEPEPR